MLHDGFEQSLIVIRGCRVWVRVLCRVHTTTALNFIGRRRMRD